ncbi:Sialin [Strongyloides ratti]|uniref:Sialin n=1 Tax=Strongyloides ratti TaxID=34506 RepID=A0A090L0M5_STRRB|nr:Sialin [Strongyloides ratti]CEF63201.1 Sialin [Strongyloides ratti]
MAKKLNNGIAYKNYLLNYEWDSDLDEECSEEDYFFPSIIKDKYIVNSFSPEDIMASIKPTDDGTLKVKNMDITNMSMENGYKNGIKKIKTYKWFPSFRMLTASLLCLCFASVHMMNSNMGMAMVCMINSTEYVTPNDTKLEMLINTNSTGAPRVSWSTEEQGYVLGAFNAGLFCMLLIGMFSDKFNSKYMTIVAVIIASTANIIIPLLAYKSVYYVIFARFLVGLGDAFLQPAVNSLLTRWFPRNERAYAFGIVTGGRQIGTLLIVSSSGALCSQTVFMNGWPSIFYLSAFFGVFFIIIYIILGADKPSKQSCISEAELNYIVASTASENMGQKRIETKTPWIKLITSLPVWAAIFSVVCHEIPLMTMIMFLPSYLHDVHHFSPTTNGIVSSLPTLAMWSSKISSSYMTSFLERKTSWRKSTICKFMNGIGSFGLAVFLIIPSFISNETSWLAVVCLCASMFCAGMHTPGCQAALVSIAPAFSGALTGLTFFFVAISGIIHPSLTKFIVQTGSAFEWNIVFYVSAFVSVLPCIIFTIWGTADVQSWAQASKKEPTYDSNIQTISETTSNLYSENLSLSQQSILKRTKSDKINNETILNYAMDEASLAGYLTNKEKN